MAAGRNIKGITVEIGGDTTKLTQALSKVNGEIRNTQAQLKDVNKLLKLDPGNTDLIAQKHKLLGQAVDETKEKLRQLQEASKQADEALANGTISQDQYDALQREIIETTEELKRLEDQARESGIAVQEIAEKGEKLKEIGGKVTDVGESMTRNLTVPIVAAGAAAIKTASDFDSSMSKVVAVSGATGKEFDALTDKAREMGAKTKFSASEAADAMNYMAMAGWKTEDMLAGIEGVMNLAAASGEDLATTSDIVTDALTAFGLTAKDSGHFADILAAASSNANTNVSMMGETFKYAAPIAGALGYSAEDTAEMIGLMANAGIKGSQAGTALRKIMTELNGEIQISGEKLGDVTIQTSNADGSMRALGDIIKDCRQAFSQLTESEQAAVAETLVGKTAMSGFLAIMNAAPGDIQKLEQAIGTCSDMLMGIRSILESTGAISTDSTWYTILSVLCGTALDMLPVLVTWSACKRYGGTQVLGIVLGLMLVSPSLPAAGDVATGAAEALKVPFFGHYASAAGFQSSVLVAIFAGWLEATLENFLRKKVIPNIVDSIFTPLLAVSITFLVTMFICGPILRQIEQWLITCATWLITLPFGIGAFIFTFAYQFIVITGCHLAFDYLDMQFLAKYGLDPIIPLVNCSIFGQLGACAAFIFHSKKKEDKASAIANTFSAFMGITEPAIFNQTLPSKGSCGLICGSIGAALGGMYCSIFGVQGSGFSLGVWSVAVFLETDPIHFIIGLVISAVVGFALTSIVLNHQEKEATAPSYAH